MTVRYYDDLFRYCLRVVKDTHDAQDLVQDVFERVLATQRNGGRIDDVRAVLYQSARNLMIDRHRFRRVRNHVGDECLADLPAEPSGDPEAVATAMQRVHTLIAAIEDLPPRCREAFVLHRIDGLTQAAVAARMGVSINMVERHVMLALLSCRRALGDAPPSKAVPRRHEPVVGTTH